MRAALSCGNRACACQRVPNTHCPCPAHKRGDQHPSLTVHVRDDRLLVNCKTGTDQRTLIAALRERGVWPEKDSPVQRPTLQQREPQPLERLVAVYEYRTTAGELYAEKGRWERPDGSKTFRWRLAGEERWAGGVRQAETPLWGAEVIAHADPAQPVIFTEGEKAAQACRDQGLLAVAAGFGSGQKDFGEALEVLRGRDVILWPDNDPAGREYMARLHGLLTPLAGSLTVTTPPVPEKGDAFDYFAAGGSVEALLDYAPPVKPVVGYLAHDAVSVRVPTPMGVVGFTFAEMEKTSRELAAEVEVRLEGPGQERDPYSQRMNLLSSGQRTELRRDLESLYGKGYLWPAVLNTALALARSAFLEQDRALKLREIPVEEEPPFLIDTLIPAGAPVVFFADGCIAGDTLIDGPDGAERADVLMLRGEPIRVWALGPAGPVAAWATAPFIKGKADLYRYSFASGRSITVTGKHRFLTPDGWQHAERLSVGAPVAAVSLSLQAGEDHEGRESVPCLPRSIEVGGPSAWRVDGRRWSQTHEGLPDRYSCDHRRYGLPPQTKEVGGLVALPSPDDARGHSWCGSPLDGLEHTAANSRSCPGCGRRSKSDRDQAVGQRDYQESRDVSWPSICRHESNQSGQPFRQALRQWQPSSATRQSVGVGAGVQYEASHPPMAGVVYDSITAIAKVGHDFFYDLTVPGYENYLAHGVWNHNSSGKSYLLMRLAIAVASGGEAAGMRALRGGALYVDYEDSASNWRRRMGRLLTGMGQPADLDLPIFHWPARGIPLHDQIDAIRRKVLKEGITLVIVDAAADACGGEPEKADIALRYFNALDKLPDGVATATIAHITNQAARGDTADRPFGSAFWHNRPRRTWYVARVQEEESDVIDVGLYCKKVNDGRKPAPIGLRITFEGKNGPVTVERASINETPELARKRSLRDLIYHVLRHRPMPVYEIADIVADLTGREFSNEGERKKYRESIAATLRNNRTIFHQTEAKAELGGRGKVAEWGRIG